MTGIALSIVITNYNARDVLANCLDSVYQNRPQCSFEVFVVDDGSSDGSHVMVQERFPQVQLLRNEKNIHYARSINRALDLVRGTYVYLLNNDTVMLPGAIDAMMVFLDAHQTVGAVGSQLFNQDGTIQVAAKPLPSLMSGLFGRRSVLTKLFPGNRFSREQLLHLKYDLSQPFTAGFVSFASIMLRGDVIRQVGSHDERLFAHGDADYCKRIWDAGWEVYCLPTAKVIHLVGQGGRMVTPWRRFKYVFEFHRDTYIYFRKHLMNSVWHPLHIVVIFGLTARFVISLSMQFGQELLRLARAV